jgi:UDP-N-acetylglucosamine 4,6-dehydratase (inverting)
MRRWSFYDLKMNERYQNMLEGKSILITGGTGSFGNKFIPMTIEKYNPKTIIIYSRDEMKQWDMSQKYLNNTKVKFVIGDVRDLSRLTSAMEGVDFVVHAAATKIVPTAEYNPFECIKTNINGAMNVIDAALSCNVKRVVALSTDKASNPINLYGATKLASDKLFVAANSINNDLNRTIFSVVRYGNVMGSRGSVIPFFKGLAPTGELPITDIRMTRFMITLEEGVKLVWRAFEDMLGGEIYVKKIPSMKIGDIAFAVSSNAKQKIIGIRPGEKIHEQMIGFEDAPHTFEYEGYYKILPAIHGWSSDKNRIKHGKKVDDNFTYTSNNNTEWMTIDDLKMWIELNKDYIGAI